MDRFPRLPNRQLTPHNLESHPGSIDGSRSWWVAWMCRELGIQYENQHTEGFLDPFWRTAEYLAINPNGLAPSIRDRDFVLWESMAINLYLAKK
jgi:glutathione S-transferase